jgi:four helix bundle protein
MQKRPYESLHVWQLAHRLALDVDEACLRLPASERFELSSQLRRSSRSVPANLVEGKGARGPRVYLRHVQIALGSVCEVDYHLLFAHDRNYLRKDLCDDLRERAWAVRGLLLKLADGLERASSRE